MTLIKVDHVINSHIILCAIKRIDSSLLVACDNGINGEWKIERRENSNWEDIKLRVNSVDTNEIHNILSNEIKSSESGFENADANEITPYMVISDGNKIKNLNFNWTFSYRYIIMIGFFCIIALTKLSDNISTVHPSFKSEYNLYCISRKSFVLFPIENDEWSPSLVSNLFSLKYIHCLCYCKDDYQKIYLKNGLYISPIQVQNRIDDINGGSTSNLISISSNTNSDISSDISSDNSSDCYSDTSPCTSSDGDSDNSFSDSEIDSCINDDIDICNYSKDDEWHLNNESDDDGDDDDDDDSGIFMIC